MNRLISGLTLLAVLASVSTIHAQSENPTPPYAAPVPTERPQQDMPVVAGKTEAIESAVEHLQQAANCLNDAGLDEMAQELTMQAEQLRTQAQLAVKLQQLRQLQREVEALRGKLNRNDMIVLSTKIIELKEGAAGQEGLRQFLGKTGLQLDKQGKSALVQLSENTDELEARIERYRKEGKIRIVAEPVVATLSGRPASVRTGGEIPIVVPQGSGKSSVEYRPVGLDLQVLPIISADDTIRLELRASYSEVDDSKGIKVNNSTVPGLRNRVFDLATAIRPGQTMALTGLNQQDKNGKSAATILLLRCELTERLPQPLPAATSRVYSSPAQR